MDFGGAVTMVTVCRSWAWLYLAQLSVLIASQGLAPTFLAQNSALRPPRDIPTDPLNTLLLTPLDTPTDLFKTLLLTPQDTPTDPLKTLY